MSHLDDFLTRHVEGYMFGDLRAMQSIEVTYPLLMTTFAGVELLGGLLSGSPFKERGKGADYFSSYWNGYLYPTLTNSESIGRTLYQLARHGIAHGFAPKGPIAVLRNEPSVHFKDISGVVHIDAVRLADDFMSSYSTALKPFATDPTSIIAQNMSARLTEMVTAYQKQAAALTMPSSFVQSTIAATAAVSSSFAVPNAPPATTPPSTPPFGSGTPQKP
jgi:hypothetical protein